MSKYKVGGIVRVVLEPSEKNKDHFLTNYYTDIPLKLGQTYKILEARQWKNQDWYLRLMYTDKYGTPRSWNVLESAVAPLFAVEEELD